MSVVYIIIGLFLLILGGNFLVKSSVVLSLKLNISKMVIGMTVVSFATSAPELLVSLQAAFNGSPTIAINNVIGSNIANIGLVLGITAIIGSISVGKSFYAMNWPVMMIFYILIYFFLSNDKYLSRVEGIVLFVCLILFLFILIKSSKNKNYENDEVDEKLASISYIKIFFWLFFGGLALYYGSELLVDGAKSLARKAGVSEAVISVTLIAIGTSIPELASSIISALKGEKAISLANLIGSNIFNIASVLGLTAIIKEIPVEDYNILKYDIIWMIVFAGVLLPLVSIPKKMEITRFKGALLFLAYLLFIFLFFI